MLRSALFYLFVSCHSQCHLLIVFVRMSYRRQKRWWNAYMLFYERLDVMDTNRRVDVDRSKLLAVCKTERDFVSGTKQLYF